MFLSVLRLRLIHSPLRPLLKRLHSLETWIYRKLKAPLPRSGD
jgi:hypothetical protein